VAVSAAGSTTCKAKAESSMTASKTAGWGGAVLQLESSDTSAAVCNTGVKQLAAWLANRQTWLGFNFGQVSLGFKEMFEVLVRCACSVCAVLPVAVLV
jgi:hypothetical protein